MNIKGWKEFIAAPGRTFDDNIPGGPWAAGILSPGRRVEVRSPSPARLVTEWARNEIDEVDCPFPLSGALFIQNVVNCLTILRAGWPAPRSHYM